MSDHLLSDYVLLDVSCAYRLCKEETITEIYDNCMTNVRMIYIDDDYFVDPFLKCSRDQNGNIYQYPTSNELNKLIKKNGILIEITNGKCSINDGLEFVLGVTEHRAVASSSRVTTSTPAARNSPAAPPASATPTR